jgi:NADP-dependent 3-hydroxy acid dehydrogenase YdfG
MRLAGRSALVTGASRGIGAAVARALAANGARVALVARSASTLEALATELGRDAFAVPADLADAEQVHRMTETVYTRLGGAPDIVVNNAGVFALAPAVETTEGLFLDTVRTNLVAPFLVMRAFLPDMRARGHGHVVTIGSIADRVVFPGNAAYASAKHAVRALHEVLRLELHGSGVRATLVSPGPVDTELWDAHLAGPQAPSLPTRETMLAPSAVADAVLYAVSQPAAVNIDELRLSHS